MKERQILQLCPVYDKAYNEFVQRNNEFPQGYHADETEIEGTVDEKGHLFIKASLHLKKSSTQDNKQAFYFFLVPLLVRYKSSEKNSQDFVPISVTKIEQSNKVPLDFELLKDIIIVKDDPNTKLTLHALKIKICSCNADPRIEVKLILKNYAILVPKLRWLQYIVPVQRREVVWYFKVRPSQDGNTKYASFQITHPSRSVIKRRKEEIIVEQDVAEIHSNRFIFIAAFKNTTRAAAFYDYKYVPEYWVVGCGFFFAAIVSLLITFLGSSKSDVPWYNNWYPILVLGLPLLCSFFVGYICLFKRTLR